MHLAFSLCVNLTFGYDFRYDFAQRRMALEDDGHLRPGTELDRPPVDDMWRDWSAEVQGAGSIGPIELLRAEQNRTIFKNSAKL